MKILWPSLVMMTDPKSLEKSNENLAVTGDLL